MKNSKIVKLVLIMIICLSILIVAKETLAATDLTDTLTRNNTVNNTTTITEKNTTNETIQNTTNSVILTTNNTSNYNNTSLPKTGVGDSMPVVILVVVLGISAVYAYKKMQDYRNI